MRFSLALLALPATTMAVNLFTQIQQNFTVVNTDIANINSTLNSIPNNSKPTNAQAFLLATRSNKFGGDVNSTIRTVQASDVLTTTQCTTLYAYLNGTLYNSANSLLANYIRHEPGLRSGGYSDLVKTQFQRLRTALGNLFAALQTKCPTQGTTNTSIRNRFFAILDRAITVFS